MAPAQLGGEPLPKRDFDTIYAQHARMVYWTAYGVVREDGRAQDVAQTVFLRVLENAKKLETMEDGQLRAWLYRVAVNAGRDVLRREKRQVPTEDVGVNVSIDEGELPESVLLNRQSRQLVRRCVDALPPLHREPILLYYFGGLNYRQIAAVLDISEGTLKSRMSRARGMLCNLLRKEETSVD